jgi:hypothetical protein
MTLIIDLTGKTFGNLTVLHRAENIPGNANARWLCQCSCGKQRDIGGQELRRGTAKHCGCVPIDRYLVHGYTRNRFIPPEYAAWNGMLHRCFNPQCRDYPSYGGRGITVCLEWRQSFPAFLRSVGPRPSDQHSIDRINNNGSYEPDNVRWATKSQQNSNRRSWRRKA